MAKPLRLRIRKTLPLMSFTLPFTLISIIIFINTAKASDAISTSDSSSHHWTPSKQRDGISSYTRDVDNSKYKAVKGVTTLPVSTARLIQQKLVILFQRQILHHIIGHHQNKETALVAIRVMSLILSTKQ